MPRRKRVHVAEFGIVKVSGPAGDQWFTFVDQTEYHEFVMFVRHKMPEYRVQPLWGNKVWTAVEAIQHLKGKVN